MQVNLTAAFAKQLELPEPAEPAAFAVAAKPDKPVLQLNSFPVTLSPDDYANARSNTNPNGSLTSLFAFRQLVDPIPAVTEKYSPSGASTERVYGNIVNSAIVTGSAGFAQNVVRNAQKDFEFIRFPNLDGSSGDWRPIYATPEDWYDVSQTNRFQKLNLDLSDDSSAESPFIILGGGTSPPLQWSTANAQQEVKASVEAISLRYLAVNLARPWLSLNIFDEKGWFLGGESKGYVSRGKRKIKGILPLLPTVLLVGIDVQVTADWTDDDSQMIDQAIQGDTFIALGPFVFSAGQNGGGASVAGSTVSSGVLHVVGWLSSVVPLSPKMADPAK